MPRLVHFELMADDIQKAKAFYEKVFDWKIEKWPDTSMEYWSVITGEKSEPGINGGLMKRQQPGQAGHNTVAVDDIDAYLKKVREAGGQITVPKTTIPKVGYLAYFTDPEGNVMGIMQTDMEAK